MPPLTVALRAAGSEPTEYWNLSDDDVGGDNRDNGAQVGISEVRFILRSLETDEIVGLPDNVSQGFTGRGTYYEASLEDGTTQTRLRYNWEPAEAGYIPSEDPQTKFGGDTGTSGVYLAEFEVFYNETGASTTPAVSEVTRVATLADSGGSLHQKALRFNGQSGSFGFWFDVDAAGASAPTSVSGLDTIVKIDTVNTGDSNTEVAYKFAAAVNAQADFSAETLAQQEITRATCVADDPGVSDGLSGKYFVAHDRDGSVLVWYSHRGGSIPAGSYDRDIEIATIADNDSADIVANKTAIAISSDSKFSATVENGNQVVYTLLTAGAVTNSIDGDTGFTFAIDQAGEDSNLLDVTDVNAGERDDARTLIPGSPLLSGFKGRTRLPRPRPRKEEKERSR